jgi:hypothetical protein
MAELKKNGRVIKKIIKYKLNIKIILSNLTSSYNNFLVGFAMRQENSSTSIHFFFVVQSTPILIGATLSHVFFNTFDFFLFVLLLLL